MAEYLKSFYLIKKNKNHLILVYNSYQLQLLASLELYALPTAAISLSKFLYYSFVEDADDPGVPDPSTLTDDDLKIALLRHGVKVGPIVGKIPLGFMFYHGCF